MFEAVRQPKDLLAGLVFLVAGGLFLLDSMNYNFGNVRRMGPGWFPTMVSILLIVIGTSIVIKSFFGRREAPPSFAWPPLAIVLAALGAFTVLLRPAGLVPAVTILVLASAAAYQPRHMTLLFTGLVGLIVSLTLLPVALAALFGASTVLGIVTAVVVIAFVGMIVAGLVLAFEPLPLLRMSAAAVAIAIFCAIVFVMLLGLPMPKFGPYLDQIIDPQLIALREVTLDPLMRAIRSLFTSGGAR